MSDSSPLLMSTLSGVLSPRSTPKSLARHASPSPNHQITPRKRVVLTEPPHRPSPTIHHRSPSPPPQKPQTPKSHPSPIAISLLPAPLLTIPPPAQPSSPSLSPPLPIQHETLSSPLNKNHGTPKEDRRKVKGRCLYHHERRGFRAHQRLGEFVIASFYPQTGPALVFHHFISGHRQALHGHPLLPERPCQQHFSNSSSRRFRDRQISATATWLH